MSKFIHRDSELEQVAGNGLLHRRLFLTQGAALLGTGGLGLLTAQPATAQELPSWMRAPGLGMSEYGQRSPFESGVTRHVAAVAGTTGSGASRTPLESLQGTITPSSLHFERHHSGIPEIDPNSHQLLIHGLVERPLIFSMDALHRYPMESRVQFLECSGNSRPNLSAAPPAGSCGDIHGMVSCSEWTGIPLSILLDEAGVTADGRWILAEGADAAAMSRSVPMAKAMDDALIALYQNGEMLRPANGYPVRLFLPGYEGNISVKWLQSLKVQKTAAYTRDETSKYTDLLKDGNAEMFSLKMEVKSLITSPSGKMKLKRKGIYEISGLAWSGEGAVRRVEVSADGGKSWAEAQLQSEPKPLALTRFRLPWRWSGQRSVLQSRAIDEKGNIQPTRTSAIDRYSPAGFYHYNGIQSWEVTPQGEVRNVFA